jgi:hypothetical protein
MPDAQDTTHAALITDHYYMEQDPNRPLCAYVKPDGKKCNLSIAAHRLGDISNAENDWDTGRIKRVQQPPGGNDEDVPAFTGPEDDYLETLTYREGKPRGIMEGGCDIGKVEPGKEFPEIRREEVLQKQGHKDDSGKAAFFYLPWEALEDVAKVMEYGAKKYAPGNYQKGMDHNRYFSALIRHMKDWWKGEDIDPESNLPHLAHAACCVLMLLENWKMGRGKDDRYVS